MGLQSGLLILLTPPPLKYPLCLIRLQSGLITLSTNPFSPLPHGIQSGLLTVSFTPLSPLSHGLTIWPLHSLLHFIYQSSFFTLPPLHSPVCLICLQSCLLTLSSTPLSHLPLGLTVGPFHSPPLHSPLCLIGLQSGLLSLSSNILCTLPHGTTVCASHSLLHPIFPSALWAYILGLQSGFPTLPSASWDQTLSSTLLCSLPYGPTVWPSHSLLHPTLPSASWASSLAFSLSHFWKYIIHEGLFSTGHTLLAFFVYLERRVMLTLCINTLKRRRKTL